MLTDILLFIICAVLLNIDRNIAMISDKGTNAQH